MLFAGFCTPKNNILIRTKKPFYYSGEIVEGSIALNIHSPIKITAITLKLKGFEKSSFYLSRHTNDRGNARVHHSDKVSFFRKKVTLFSSDDKSEMAAGMYEFPFSFALDTGLPSSIIVKKGDSTGQILYKCKAELHVAGFMKSNLKYSTPIAIHETLRKELGVASGYKEGKVTFLCCLERGNASMQVTFDKNAYAAGELVGLFISIDNSQSQVDLKYVSLKLIRKVNLKAGCSHFSYSEAISTVRSGIGIGSGCKSEQQISLPLPPDTVPSSSGKIVKCEYILNVSLSIPWSPDLIIKQSVQIYVPSLPNYIQHVSSPPEWSPFMYPKMVLDDGNLCTY